MPLYDILNEFQKGQSHMAAVFKRMPVAKNDMEDNKKIVSGSKKDDFQSSGKEVGFHVKIDMEKARDDEDALTITTGFQEVTKTESTECVDDLEEGEVIGIITLEDVIEELLQVSLFITFIILEFTGPLNHMNEVNYGCALCRGFSKRNVQIRV